MNITILEFAHTKKEKQMYFDFSSETPVLFCAQDNY